MGKPHPIELRERAIALVEQGSTHTETAKRLCVSVKFVNDMVRLKREPVGWSPSLRDEAVMASLRASMTGFEPSCTIIRP